MRELSDKELSALTTKRLYSLFKSVREKLKSSHGDDYKELNLYKQRIKDHLDKRDHLERF